jgi:hypothetical protein
MAKLEMHIDKNQDDISIERNEVMFTYKDQEITVEETMKMC